MIFEDIPFKDLNKGAKVLAVASYVVLALGVTLVVVAILLFLLKVVVMLAGSF